MKKKKKIRSEPQKLDKNVVKFPKKSFNNNFIFKHNFQLIYFYLSRNEIMKN